MSRGRLLTVSGPDAGQGDDGGPGQGKALVQDGGHESAGQGEGEPIASVSHRLGVA